MYTTDHYSPLELFELALAETPCEAFTNGNLRLLFSGLSALCRAQKKPLTKNEHFAVSSMVAYAAHSKGLSQDKIKELLTITFKAPKVDMILSQDFENVMSFLQNFQPHKIVN